MSTVVEGAFHVDEMIYESILEDVGAAIVPYETAPDGFVFSMVYESCFAGTDSPIRALVWAGAWHPPTLSWVPAGRASAHMAICFVCSGCHCKTVVLQFGLRHRAHIDRGI